MNELQITARMRIHDGKLEEFKAIAQNCMDTVRQMDTGTLQYDWYFNADETECVVYERYANSSAVLEHVRNLGENLGALLGASSLVLEVCGSPSGELVSSTEGLDIAFYRPFQGMEAPQVAT